MAEVERENFAARSEAIEPHELKVREYLSATLDGQIGRSEARFRQYLLAERSLPMPSSAIAGEPPVPQLFQGSPLSDRGTRLSSRGFGPRIRGWTLGIAGAALAASLAALWAGPSLRPLTGHSPTSTTAPQTASVPHSTVADPLLVEQDVHSQTFDDGTFITDDSTPVRVLRRRDYERTRWFDQNRQLKGEEIVPQDHMVYVQLKTY